MSDYATSLSSIETHSGIFDQDSEHIHHRHPIDLGAVFQGSRRDSDLITRNIFNRSAGITRRYPGEEGRDDSARDSLSEPFDDHDISDIATTDSGSDVYNISDPEVDANETDDHSKLVQDLLRYQLKLEGLNDRIRHALAEADTILRDNRQVLSPVETPQVWGWQRSFEGFQADRHQVDQFESASRASESSTYSTQSNFLHNITLSWDQTQGSHFHIERLQTVLGRAPSPEPVVQEPIKATGNHALEDYQMQLMLLEQQNKKRLMLARQQQDQVQDKNTEGTVENNIARVWQNQKDTMFKTTTPIMNEQSIGSNGSTAVKSSSQRATNGVTIDPMETIELLLAQISKLEAEKEGLNVSSGSRKEVPDIPIFYRIGADDLTYVGQPRWSLTPENKRIVLQGTDSIGNLENYLKYNSRSPFVVVRTYDTGIPNGLMSKQSSEVTTLPEPQHIAESIMLVTSDMKDAVKAFLQIQQSLSEGFVSPDMESGVLEAPYLFWYHLKPSVVWDNLDPLHADLIKRLTDWIEEHYRTEYRAANVLFQKGLVTFSNVKYLIKPGDILIQGFNKKETRAFEVVAWPRYTSWSQPPSRQEKQNPRNSGIRDWRWQLECWGYDFVGKFYRANYDPNLILKVANMEDEVPIRDLNLFPLRFAGEEVQNMLERRGQRFWKCRERHLISYDGSANRSLTATNDRYVIDYETYTTLETKSSLVSKLRDYEQNGAPAPINDEELPSVPHTYLFPSKAIAYNLRRKKWVDLDMNSVCDVTWNKKAFDYLVLDEETKELVLALITNKLAADSGADLIENKGRGLIMLLHGGPGTGKTLTAESVAEIAEKPLFRVTCADIGTKPQVVEKYLEGVLHLAKIWDCVVLLDEADVFLEQRTLNDLSRNALVSVFLRILEYFEGILILTSNRVGTFDEAFKSRIQLSLHYENLSKSQRHKIWKNFFKQLRTIPNVNIDFDDVDCSTEELAQFEMNGREIRNAITTARQLAQFKKKLMTTMHLKHVIRVGSKFDSYLKTVQEGLTPDEIARGEGIR